MKKIFFSSYVLLGLIGLVLVACANEQGKVAPAKMMPSSADAYATALALATNIINGGQTGYLYVTGNGTADSQNFDGVDYTNNTYTVNSNGVVTVKLAKDTVWVKEFGVQLIGKPENINTVDSVNAEKIGKLTTMSTWSFSDGQTADGWLLYLMDRTANEKAQLPHAVVENLRFNKVFSIEVLNERFALVTLSFFADVRGENSPSTSGENTEEVRLTYIQALPEPEVVEPKGPTYSWDLTFTFSDGKGKKPNKLVATMTVNSSEGLSWSNSWYAAQVGNYNNMDVLFAESTTLVSKEQDAKDDPSLAQANSFEKDGATWELSQKTQVVTDYRKWMSKAYESGASEPMPVGPEMTVYFNTTGVVFTAPTGEKINVKLTPETSFTEDGFSTVQSLVGDVQTLPNEATQYVYAKSYTFSAKHYVSCTVVDVDGTEKSFPIDCLNDGLLRHNVCTTNLYTLK